MIEPAGRHTAPAVLAAVLQFAAKNPDALMLVAPLGSRDPRCGPVQCDRRSCRACSTGRPDADIRHQPRTTRGRLRLS
jgi:hypothetical protein